MAIGDVQLEDIIIKGMGKSAKASALLWGDSPFYGGGNTRGLRLLLQVRRGHKKGVWSHFWS